MAYAAVLSAEAYAYHQEYVIKTPELYQPETLKPYRHIRAYTREGEIIFDPFAGSGVVAIEAARNKRRAIVVILFSVMLSST